MVGAFGPSITYIFEICGAKHRSKITLLVTGLPWSLGYSLVAMVAQLTQHWWWLMFVLVVVSLPYPFLLHMFVPESYVYLAAVGKHYDARKAAEKFPRNEQNPEEKPLPARKENPLLSSVMAQEGEFLASVTSFASISLARNEKTGSNSAFTGMVKNKFMLLSFILLIIIW